MSRSAVGAALCLAMLAAACATDTSSAGPQERQVFVDYEHDEFASFYIANFPERVEMRPGDTVVFKQTWTGEPHTVTMGTKVDQMMKIVVPLLEEHGDKEEEDVPPEVMETFEKATEGLPWMFGDGDELNQTAAQPCLIETGEIPTDGSPCPEKDLPAFNGRQTYYNSGFIPYEGPRGNTVRVPLADDLEPGKYYFYCAVHGPFQRGEIEVKPKGSSIPSQAEVNRRARAEIQEMSKPLLATFRQATRGSVTVDGRSARPPFAGLFSPEADHAGINEFVPRRITTNVGDPVTWKIMGADHSISFQVPKYFPVVEILEDGTVRINPQLQPPAGGAPPLPEDESGPPEGEGPAEGAADETDTEARPSEEEGPPPAREPQRIDGGVYDGRGFWSSGLISSWRYPWVEYTIRFSRPGTYRYACLLHPPMIGTVEVKA